MISGFWKAKKYDVIDSGGEEVTIVSFILMKLEMCS